MKSSEREKLRSLKDEIEDLKHDWAWWKLEWKARETKGCIANGMSVNYL